ncbi:MAG: hypothetical protein LBB61_02000 [Treponema sp.]|nr:hypothetical protein [Treponema sp.]
MRSNGFSEDGEAGHVCDALMTARTNRKPKSGLLFHSDRTEADKAEGRQTKKEERVAVCEYREPYYNKRRRHSAHGYATPIALTHYGAAYPTVRHIGGSPP